VLQALLRGLGLPALDPKLPPAALAETVGAMLREALRGTMGVLAARATSKREFRADVTLLAAQGNNPLKFFAAVDDALKQMLTSEQPGYMSALKAIGFAFDDIKAHELALFAGMREALLRVLTRFDPVATERELKAAGALDSIVPANRKARLWDRQLELYAEVVREADDDFQRLFGECFAAAYEEQVRRVRAVINRQRD
jgi:FHA domain-containing protein/type VI secretion system protein